MAKRDRVTPSSGNVFADLELPDADERLAKAELVRIIRRILRERDLTQREAGELLGLRQPDVSDLLRGNLTRFSRERIERSLILLGMDVSIHVAPKGRRRSRARLTVEVSA